MKTKTPTCTVCKRRDAFFFRPYSGERLCRGCFVASIEVKVRATVAKYQMLEFNDKTAVAVSGGKDSTSLLHILAKIERDYPKSSLVAVTVDEGIKGYRDEALRLAVENCKKLGIKHKIVSFEGLYGYGMDEIVERVTRSGEGELTPCAYCGVLRRRALNIAARDAGADKLATGHSLDDETQTFLLNVSHGDPLRTAREKPVTDEVHPKLVQKIKPFCEILEKEIALYAYIMDIQFQNKPCPYASEALRNDIRKMLNRIEHEHSGIKYTVFRSIEKIRSAMETACAKEGLNECSICGEPTTAKICRTCQIFRQLGLSE